MTDLFQRLGRQKLPRRRGPRPPTWLVISVAIVASSCERIDRSAPEVEAEIEVVITETGFEMVRIPAGQFEMGSRRGKENEVPVHEVRLDSFFMDRYEVTQERFAKIAERDPYLARDPSHFKAAARPVEMISWSDAALFCNERSRAEGLEPCYDEETAECNFDANGYRLPTEAEWEYACRAGSRGDFFFDEDSGRLASYAWFKGNANEKTQLIGRKSPNDWRLYDMLGNVAEWCNDIYDEDYYASSPLENPRGPSDGDKYLLRGGAWNSSPETCRSSYRVGEDPGFQDACFARDAIGFRCVRSVGTTSREETQ